MFLRAYILPKSHLFVGIGHHWHSFLQVLDGLHTKLKVIASPGTRGRGGGDGGLWGGDGGGSSGGVGRMGGGLATAGRGLGGRGQLGTEGLGHHIEGMLQGVAKYRKTTSYQLEHVQNNDSMIFDFIC